MQLDLARRLEDAGLLAVVLTFFMVELFDASGTLVASAAGPACSRTRTASCRA